MKNRNKRISQNAPLEPLAIKLPVVTPLNSVESLNALFAQPRRAVLAFKLKEIQKQVSEILRDYDLTRIELCKEFGELNAETNQYEFSEEGQPVFNERFCPGEVFAARICMPL